jgi:WD40 repeat protein
VVNNFPNLQYGFEEQSGRATSSADFNVLCTLWPPSKNSPKTILIIERVATEGSFAVSASSDKTLKVWSLSGGKALWTLKGHEGRVAAVVIDKDKQWVISGGWDKSIKVWA